jgi:hypothetical protein
MYPGFEMQPRTGTTVGSTFKLVSFIENFQWEVFLHDCITYLSKYLFIVLLLYRLQIKWDV